MLFKIFYLIFCQFIWMVYYMYVFSFGILFFALLLAVFAGAVNVALVIVTVLIGGFLFLKLTFKKLPDGGKV